MFLLHSILNANQTNNPFSFSMWSTYTHTHTYRRWANNSFCVICNAGAKTICAVDSIGYSRRMVCTRCHAICNRHCARANTPKSSFWISRAKTSVRAVPDATIGWMRVAFHCVDTFAWKSGSLTPPNFRSSFRIRVAKIGHIGPIVHWMRNQDEPFCMQTIRIGLVPF